MKNYLPATLLCDFYKVSHKNLYPKGTELIYSTFTPRSSKHGNNLTHVVNFGVQGFIKKYLINYFNEHFFNRSKDEVVNEYKRVIKFTLGINNPDTSHIEKLHDLKYLPIKIKSLKEGTLVPIKVPLLTIENTHKDFFWLTNYLETLLSTELWQAITSATKAHEFRKLLDKYALLTVGNTKEVGFSGHDFSLRGMSSLETGQLSGAGHLLSFFGTDTIPAIIYHEEFYGANIEKELVGGSVIATEHSIQSALTSADGDRDEYEAYKYLITEACTEGIMSIVSDTYDFWRVVGETLPKLKNEIMNRNGKIVIRPDTGIPELILCGDDSADNEFAKKGLVESLWDIFGGTVNSKGYKELDPHIGCLYGDSINQKNATTICEMLEKKGFATTNVTYGMGSFLYQYNSRDTYGFAMKATYAEINGESKLLLKDPKTGDGTKKSQRGVVAVIKNPNNDFNATSFGDLILVDGLTKETYKYYESRDQMETVFLNGHLMREQSLSQIRELLNKERNVGY